MPLQKNSGVKEVKTIGAEKGTGRFVNHVEETAEKEQIANMYDYCYETTDKTGEKESHAFQWITTIEVTEKKLEEMVTAGCGDGK